MIDTMIAQKIMIMKTIGLLKVTITAACKTILINIAPNTYSKNRLVIIINLSYI